MKRGTLRSVFSLSTIAILSCVASDCLGPVKPKMQAQTQTVAARSISRPTECPMDKALVSLTYDDGLPSQIAVAIPQLDEYGFKGTFFLNDVAADPSPWQGAAAKGHELGSHTFSHPCTAAFDWVKRGNASEDFDLSRMAGELDEQSRILSSLGQPPPFSFAYPCGTTWLGKEQTSFVPLIEKRFVAARGTEGSIVTDTNHLTNVPAYFFEGDAGLFIERIQAAIQVKGWAVFGFHGVGGDYLSVTADTHRAMLAWLLEHRNEVAVLPFGPAAQCLKQKTKV